MSKVIKVIEVLAQSDVSCGKMQRKILAQRLLRVLEILNLSIIKDRSAKVKDNKIVKYRITAKISFLID